MSIHAVAETARATTDAQVIEDMAADVLATVARIHADGLAVVNALAEAPRPIRLELPPAAQPTAEPVPEAGSEAPAVEVADGEPADVVLADDALLDEPVVRIAEPLLVVPSPRGRHLAEAVTDEIAVTAAA